MNRQQAHIRWILQLRWVAAACFLTLLVVVEVLYDWWLPTGALLALFGYVSLSGLGLRAWSLRRGGIREPILVAVIVADIGALTAVLALSNGPLNPFTSLYFLYIAVAAVALSPPGVAVVVVVSIGAYGWLYLLHPGAHGAHPVQGHLLHLHLTGMWIAYAFTAPFLALSLHLVRRSLSRYEAQLAQARRETEQAQKLAALATLATGAAHELATPLGTIAVAAHELAHRLRHDPEAADDAHLICAEVERCSAILRQLAADAGEGRGEGPKPVLLSDLLADITEGFPATLEILPPALAHQSLLLPPDLLRRALRGLVKNAALAAPQSPIRLRLRQEDPQHPLLLEIIDAGPPIPPAIRARMGEPFFTTRPPGQGMGLGVFFARETLRRLGGDLSYPPPEPGQGTLTRVHLPPA